MLYGSIIDSTNPKAKEKRFTLELTEAENKAMLAGKPLRHLIGMATESGVITVSFKRNSKKRHQVYLGA